MKKAQIIKAIGFAVMVANGLVEGQGFLKQLKRHLIITRTALYFAQSVSCSSLAGALLAVFSAVLAWMIWSRRTRPTMWIVRSRLPPISIG